MIAFSWQNQEKAYRENVKCFLKDFWFNSPPSVSYEYQNYSPRTVFIKEAAIPKTEEWRRPQT